MGVGLRGSAVGVLLSVGLPLGLGGCTLARDGADRWADLPHAMGCQFTPGDTAPDGPGSTWPIAVRFTHDGDQRVRLDVEFLFAVPRPPRRVETRLGITEAPGSISMTFLISPAGRSDDKVISIDTFGDPNGRKWRADASEFDETAPDLLESVSSSDRVLSFVLDLAPVEKSLALAKFQADVDVVTMIAGRIERDGTGNVFPVKSVECRWDMPMPVRAAPPPEEPPPLVPAPSSPVSPTAPDDNLRWQFTSPTGNIACDLNGVVTPPVAACEVRENTYGAPVRPTCDPGWVTRFMLRQGQTVETDCYSETKFGDALPVQEYGKPLTVGSITCVIEESSGVNCSDSSAGHSFQAARQEYRVS